ncbi:MAG TPA: lycopene cyclase family protein [Flavisolibacter sp.]|jgi:lycopene beta-cyclase|nr:lycopene cyclase family protein [Flavisolibacter sp.]
MPQKQYDYIIAGMGCAGLSLAMHMIKSGRFSNKKILLVDEAPKNKNDRTWCFWETEPGLFESIVYKRWEHLWFYSDNFYKEFSIRPYHYKMIRGIDFYNYCYEEIKQHPAFEIGYGKVEQVFSDTKTGVVIGGEIIYSEYVFNSILFEKPLLKRGQHWLLQHFKGWKIQLEESTFDHQVATLMDFRIPQQHGTAFCYLLPFSATEALIEYTLFTPSLLKEQEYEAELKNYIQHILHIDKFTITEKESGIIPMTNFKFPTHEANIINIGTAGGQTKGSSGYTFYFIQKHCKELMTSLAKTGKPFIAKPSPKFHFYDSVLLHILANNTLPGKDIFSTLFEKNKVQNVLRFLNNESSILQDIQIISSLPTLPFIKAAAKQYF